MKILSITSLIRNLGYVKTRKLSETIHYRTIDKIYQPIPALIRWALRDSKVEYKL